MAILGSVLRSGIKLTNRIQIRRKTPAQLQRKTLFKLLSKAQKTEFGQKYGFSALIETILFDQRQTFYKQYCQTVPIFNYEQMYNEWWHKAREDEADVCWPGRVKYFALSSGTSGAASKYIPVTKAMSRAIQKTSIRQILSLGKYENLPSDLYEKGFLMLGGSTKLNFEGNHFEGDLSGISAKQIPFWFQQFYKPGKKIAKVKDWAEKLEQIVEQAPKWDIGFIVGVPAWLQIVMEKIIERYKVKNIHEIWPNLRVFGHGGVSFEPYKTGFEKLIDPEKPLIYMDTYLASEGFLAIQNSPDAKGMELVLDNGIFFEFIPFNETNFDDDGELLNSPKTLMIDEIEEGVDYALVISTCSGAWRYLIGDTVKFINKEHSEIIITGRTKHFLSLCGEHLSVDNMNRAVELASSELNIEVREFTVVGKKNKDRFAHHWYIGTDSDIDNNLLRDRIDHHLKILNDDYVVERQHGLNEVFVTTLSPTIFYGWLEKKGKLGGQNKFPRVLKKNLIEDWNNYLATFVRVHKSLVQPSQGLVKE